VGTPYWLDASAPSYGPLAGDEAVEVAVVGAGVTGLACARALASAGKRVRVIEARRAGSGASGRNGGFAPRGTAASYDLAPLRDVVRATEEALVRIRALAGDAFRPVGSLRVATSEDELAAVHAEADALAADGFAVEWRDAEELPPAVRGRALGGIFHGVDGALDQGTWIRRLAALAHDAGAAVAEDTRVLALDGGRVETERGTVEAESVVVATDGYTDGLVPELDTAIAAVRGQVVATAPLAADVLPCPLHGRWGYDYAQQLRDGRIVAGGRRDLDLEAETGLEELTTDAIQAGLEALLAELVGSVPEITHRWAGIMGFTDDLLPLVGPLPGRDGVWVSAGYSGHGNVLGFACGEAVAAALLGRPEAWLETFSPGRSPAARPPA
jgi:glycine/D-amino acid oxidase-like deaminating enzyme